MLTLGHLCGYGGEMIVPSFVAGAIGVIVSNYYHCLNSRWGAGMVGAITSSLLFILGVFL